VYGCERLAAIAAAGRAAAITTDSGTIRRIAVYLPPLECAVKPCGRRL
jgi:hypothetical protein